MSAEFPTDHDAKSLGDRSKDLFGEPASPYRDPSGRKKLKLTNDLSDKVAVLRAAGMDRQQIADAIGCCKKTLETLFFTIAERRQGGQARRGEKLEEFDPREVRRLLIGHYEMRYEIQSATNFVRRISHTREDR